MTRQWVRTFLVPTVCGARSVGIVAGAHWPSGAVGYNQALLHAGADCCRPASLRADISGVWSTVAGGPRIHVDLRVWYFSRQRCWLATCERGL
jgi:hypothetical protein